MKLNEQEEKKSSEQFDFTFLSSSYGPSKNYVKAKIVAGCPDGISHLRSAIRQNEQDTVEYLFGELWELIEKASDEPVDQKFLPLLFAAQCGKLDIVKFIVSFYDSIPSGRELLHQ